MVHKAQHGVSSIHPSIFLEATGQHITGPPHTPFTHTLASTGNSVTLAIIFSQMDYMRRQPCPGNIDDTSGALWLSGLGRRVHERKLSGLNFNFGRRISAPSEALNPSYSGEWLTLISQVLLCIKASVKHVRNGWIGESLLARVRIWVLLSAAMQDDMVCRDPTMPLRLPTSVHFAT